MTSAAASITPPDADRPAHYRLKDGTWEVILKEYVEGATAGFLARKWRVSEHAVRARITKHKATKRDWGDSQALSQAAAREAEFEEARRNSPEAVAARLFDGIEAPTGDAAADPAHLAKVATLASGRAMTGRLWTEAKALAGLAESYARLVQKADAATLTIDDLPLSLVLSIWRGDGVVDRMAITPRLENDPENPIRRAYWKLVYDKTPRAMEDAQMLWRVALDEVVSEREDGEAHYTAEDIARAEEMLSLLLGGAKAETVLEGLNDADREEIAALRRRLSEPGSGLTSEGLDQPEGQGPATDDGDQA